jgi:hypothetical protein
MELKKSGKWWLRARGIIYSLMKKMLQFAAFLLED